MALGFFLFRQDKTTCGGKIIEGIDDHGHFGQPIACEGHAVTCGKHPGTYRISGGMRDSIHGKRIAGTLHSTSTCPCKATFIHTSADGYEFNDETTVSHSAAAPPVTRPEPEQYAQTPKVKTSEYSGLCKPEDNPLLNGVYLWTEVTGSGHAFVSVHENGIIYLYSYGRYGRTDRSTLTGDGILDFFQGEDARRYYRYELYEMGARVFRIDDADSVLTRQFFENLWNNSAPSIQTPKMEDGTKRRGHTIDRYDVTGSNCATHSAAAIKFAGSKVFENSYNSTTTQLPIESEEDFTIPVSLQNYLDAKSSDFSSMLVIEMTNTFKKQYPNIENKSLQPMGGSAKIQQSATESSAMSGATSPYSGGTIGGSLGSSGDK